MKLPKIVKAVKPVIAHQLEMLLLYYYSAMAKKRRPDGITGNILLARTDGLGDFVIWLSCAQTFRQMYPGKKIFLMLDSTKPTLELAERMPDLFDEVFNIDVHNYTRFFSIFKMRRMEFDLVVQPVYSRVFFTDILLFACKAKRRITLDTSAKFLTNRQKALSNRGYDRIVSASGGIEHELIRCGELIRGLGVPGFKAGLPQFKTADSEKQPMFISFPGASAPSKIWSAANYADILDEIIERSGWKCVMGGGGADIPILEKIHDLMKNKNRVKIIAGKYELSDTLRFINHSRLAIGNDTGAMHMAVASGIPSIVLMGDNEIGRFFPYTPETGEKPVLWVVDADLDCKGCNAVKDVPCQYPLGQHGTCYCIESITAEQCLKAVYQFFEMVGIDEGKN